MILVPILGTTNRKIVLRLNRVGKEEELVIVFAGKGDDRIDLDVSAIHTAPKTRGRVTVRGVLRDRATARVSGLIKIKKKAQGSDDFLEERTLLLGKEARIEALPDLRIGIKNIRYGVTTKKCGAFQVSPTSCHTFSHQTPSTNHGRGKVNSPTTK